MKSDGPDVVLESPRLRHLAGGAMARAPSRPTAGDGTFPAGGGEVVSLRKWILEAIGVDRCRKLQKIFEGISL